MTTREEAIAMMDWLRYAGAIGTGCPCETDDGDHLDYPERCDEEYREYLAGFEILLRNDLTHHVYYAIRQAARRRWQEVHGEGITGPFMAARCALPLPSVEIEAVRVTDSKLEPIPQRRWWWPFRQKC